MTKPKKIPIQYLFIYSLIDTVGRVILIVRKMFTPAAFFVGQLYRPLFSGDVLYKNLRWPLVFFVSGGNSWLYWH